ncbi:hypothetical protein V6N13_050817 [Hibiscus sabdariffa]|uniref:Uncharacterized protein n=1 Tax=Hibiscus sabdariffa TaxID=183260 RepID=A0ABR2PIT4_9ROSI
MESDQGGIQYSQMQPEPTPSMMSQLFSFTPGVAPESTRILFTPGVAPSRLAFSTSYLKQPSFPSLGPTPAISAPCFCLTLSNSDTNMQFKWRLLKSGSHVFYLHFVLKKRLFIEEIHEKQEQVKEWLQNLGIGDHVTVGNHGAKQFPFEINRL